MHGLGGLLLGLLPCPFPVGIRVDLGIGSPMQPAAARRLDQFLATRQRACCVDPEPLF